MTYNAPVKRESDNQLGRAMWQWRTEQHLSMRGAAERLGVSHSTWGALERGERAAEADTLQRLADLLQRSVDELMRWEGRASFRSSADDAERDPRLADKLKAELPGILAWAVRGCLEWQRSGLQEPAEVSAATSAYRSEMDIIGQFLDENCVTGTRYEVACAELYAAYDRWCDEGGERSINQRRFGAQMSERGIQREHRRKGWVYIGVGLVTDHYDDEPPPARKPAPTPAETPQETIERDLCDPCDPNSPIFTREQETWERSGKLDHIDHMDHTSEDLALAVNAPLPPPGANFPWASVRLLLEQVPYERRP